MTAPQIIDRNDPFSGAALYRARLAADSKRDGFDSLETQTVRSENVASGASTLYTVPAGKRARTGDGVLYVSNPTGGGIATDIHIVPSGGAAGVTNKLIPTTTFAAGSHQLLFASIWMALMPGSAIVINPGGAGLCVYGTFLEERSELCSFIGGFDDNLPASETTLITVPARRALAVASVVAYNDAVAARTLTVHNRASGVAASAVNQILTTSINAATGYSFDLSRLPTQSEGGIVSAIGSNTQINVWISAVLY